MERRIVKCPECGTWTEILESVLRADGSRRRRYQCANLHKFSTVERIEVLKTGGWRHGLKRDPNGRFSTATKKEDVL
jgi:transcriptional regulator NrdR family protein